MCGCGCCKCGWSWQEVVVVVCLTLSYAAAGGSVYCIGLMQSVWIDQVNITSSDASLINSLMFATTLLPSPAIQAIRDYFTIPPFSMFAAVIPFLSAGFYFTSISYSFTDLLLSNVLGFGIGILLAVTGSLTTVYHYFLDDKVIIVTSVVSSGVGFGMIVVSLSFKYLEPKIGWRKYWRWQMLCGVVYALATILFFPPISKLLGIHTRKEKERKMRKEEKKKEQLRAYQEQKEINEEKEQSYTNEIVVPSAPDAFHNTLSSSSPKDLNASCPALNDDIDGYETPKQQPGYQDGEISTASCSIDHRDTEELINRSDELLSISQSIRIKTVQLWKQVISNPCFLLLMVSWFLAEATFNAVMVHQPARIVAFGYSLQNGADTLAINGAVQICARFGVGILSDREIVSVARLSQASKLILGVFSILSNFFTSLTFQTVYMFLVGACGGILSTTDFILVKDCVTEGREMGITVLLLVDGIFSLSSIAGAGYMYSYFDNYDVVFYTLGSSSLVAFLSVVIMEIMLKRRNNQRANEGYAAF